MPVLVPPLQRPLSFVPNRDSLQAQGLVAWWPLTARTQGRDLAGVNAADSGLGAATFIGQPLVGQALSNPFDADYYSFPATHSLPLGSTSRTFAFWLNVDSTVNYNIAIEYGALAAANRLLIIALSSAPFIGVQGGLAYEVNGATAYTTGSVLTAGAWTHVVAVQNGTTVNDVTFSVNGYAVAMSYNVGGTTINTTQGPGHYLMRSQDTIGTAGFFDGLLTDFRVYNRPLSPAEVFQLWAPQTRWALYDSGLSLVPPSFLHDVGGPLPHPSPQLRRAPGLLSSA